MRRISKAILSISLAACLMLGDAGVALAAPNIDNTSENQVVEAIAEDAATEAAYEEAYEEAIEEDTEEAVEEDVYEETEEPVVEAEELQNATVSNLKLKFITPPEYSNTLTLKATWSGDADSYEVYVNDKFMSYIYGTKSFEMTAYLDTKYTVKVVPVTGGTSGTPVSATATRASVLKIVPSSSYAGVSMSGDVINCTNAINVACKERGYYSYSLERKQGTGKWQVVAEGSNSVTYGTNFNFTIFDYSAMPGVKYSYRVRTSRYDYQFDQTFKGAYSKVATVKTKVTTDIDLDYDARGLVVDVDSRTGTGYEVYRSTKKSSGYKKIGTTYTGEYVDKSVKSGDYFYKVRPFYIVPTTGKKYYFDYSKPKEAVIVLGGFSTTVSRTAAKKFKVSWDKAKGATSYEVYLRKQESGRGYKLAKTTTATSVVLTGEKNMSYSVLVKAVRVVNGVKYFSVSSDRPYVSLANSISVSNLHIAKVSTSVSGTKATSTVTLAWDKVFGAKKIEVYGANEWYGTDALLATLKPTATSCKIKNTKTVTTSEYGWSTATKKYSYYTVKLVTSKGTYTSAIYSGDDAPGLGSEHTGSFRLAKVTNLAVKKDTSGLAKLTWKSVKNANCYDVLRVNQFGYQSTTRVNGTSFVDNYAIPGIKYTYYVRAVNDKCYIYSAYNKSVTFTGGLASPKLTANNSGSSYISFSWTNPAQVGKVSYEVYRATSKTGKYTKLASGDMYAHNSDSTYYDGSLDSSKTYYYKVKVTYYNALGKKYTSTSNILKKAPVS